MSLKNISAFTFLFLPLIRRCFSSLHLPLTSTIWGSLIRRRQLSLPPGFLSSSSPHIFPRRAPSLSLSKIWEYVLFQRPGVDRTPRDVLKNKTFHFLYAFLLRGLLCQSCSQLYLPARCSRRQRTAVQADSGGEDCSRVSVSHIAQKHERYSISVNIMRSVAD